MTKQENFKHRIRARMVKTGERYSAARAALLAEAANRSGRTWVAEPEFSDGAVQEATGRGWDEWCDAIDAGPDFEGDHTAIAAYLRDELSVDAWWSQSITVGYERITGLRLPYQRADGTFTAGRSATITLDAAGLRSALFDDADRADLFPGYTTELLSRSTAKAIRISIGPGVAHFGIDERGDGRVKVSIDHRKLPTFDDVAEWKFYWGEWLDAAGETPLKS